MSGQFKRLLCLGDSLGKPRGRPCIVTLEDTWPTILQKELGNFKVIRNFTPSKQSKDIIEEIQNDVTCYFPDVIIVQVGVVELYPRCLSRVELEIVKRTPVLRDIWRVISKRYRSKIVKMRNLSYASLDTYVDNLLEFRELNPGKKIVYIPPLPHPPIFERSHSPGYNDRVFHLINHELFKQYFDYDFLLKFAESSDLMVSDGHHLSVMGHRVLADKLIEICEVI